MPSNWSQIKYGLSFKCFSVADWHPSGCPFLRPVCQKMPSSSNELHLQRVQHMALLSCESSQLRQVLYNLFFRCFLGQLVIMGSQNGYVLSLQNHRVIYGWKPGLTPLFCRNWGPLHACMDGWMDGWKGKEIQRVGRREKEEREKEEEKDGWMKGVGWEWERNRPVGFPRLWQKLSCYSSEIQTNGMCTWELLSCVLCSKWTWAAILAHPLGKFLTFAVFQFVNWSL